MEIADLYKLYLQYPSIQTDSRKVKQGDIYVALTGDRYDGNDFVRQALKQGAAYCISDADTAIKHEQVIQVKDALQTLQQLGLHHRRTLSIPLIAITGSNGKTTTKELVHVVLRKKYNCFTTEGNFNNHIGIPLTLLKIKPEAEIAVVEMGANHLKEIESYCSYVEPTHGTITNCGKAHLEGFGGIEGVRKGKGELFVHLQKNNGVAFINTDHDYLLPMSEGIQRRILFGRAAGEIQGTAILQNGMLGVEMHKGWESNDIFTKLVGKYNLGNVLTAITIGKYFNVEEVDIIDAIVSYTPSNSRSQMMQTGSVKIILDAYNANPSSMHGAIANLVEQGTNNTALYLGEMKELGEDSAAEHEQLQHEIAKHTWKDVVLVGKAFADLENSFLHFDTAAEAGKYYQAQNYSNCTVLVKGSRSIAMEKILEKED